MKKKFIPQIFLVLLMGLTLLSTSGGTVSAVESESRTSDSTILLEESLVNESSTIETTSLYRLYHRGLKVHLYTKSANEYKVLGTRGWKQEGVAW